MRKDQCMHCEDPGCLRACPADGAIVQYTNGIVDFQQENCIGCQYCVSGCPFDIPKFNSLTKKVYKCTLCSDRVGQGLEPACIKACPTGCLKFGTKMDMRALADARAQQLREHSGFADAGVYDGELLRHPVYTRLLHWSVAAFFILALLSGFAIYTPWLYRGLTPLFGGGPQTRMLHPWFSLGFVLFFALQVLNWLQPMMWT